MITRTLENNNTPTEDRALTSINKVNVAIQGDHEFFYSVTPEIFGAPCLPVDLCFTCIYDLEIDVLNDCQVSMMPGGLPITKKIGTINEADVFNNNCTAIPFNLAPSPLIIEDLPVGELYC